MKKTNVKRAFKTLVKQGYGKQIFIENLSNNKILVSNGHVILTVPKEDFENNKDIFNKCTISEVNFSKLINLNENTQPAKLTTVSISLNDHYCRILKTAGALTLVNELYLDALRDVGSSLNFETVKPKGDYIKTPLIESVVVNGEILLLNCVLPISGDIKETLNRVLSCESEV